MLLSCGGIYDVGSDEAQPKLRGLIDRQSGFKALE